MRIDQLRILGSVVAIVLLFMLLNNVYTGFTVFEFAPSEIENTLVPISEEMSHEIGQVLWGYRQQELIVLAFLLFITGASCSSILRAEGREEK